MANLIPLAGAGERFVREGFTVPKPLIDVSGLPMIVQAARALPPSRDWVFVVRREHVEEHGLDRVLDAHFPGCRLVAIDYRTEGQACSCLLGEPHVDPDGELTIGACDNSMLWDADRWERLRSDPDVDAVLWTFRHHVSVERNPKAYGFVRTDGDVATGISCKVPLSGTPGEDHAIVGTFWFRRARDFFDGVRRQMAEDRRVNGEFYVDVTFDVLIRAGARVRVFEVDRYICWGTPDDLRTWRYWESWFRRPGRS